ncbi:MAG TPA: hypothetical protein VN810_11070, partial [Terriglobales bacterium]|nr:hypothetical protein [Terriglobales bacterium]
RQPPARCSNCLKIWIPNPNDELHKNLELLVGALRAFDALNKAKGILFVLRFELDGRDKE